MRRLGQLAVALTIVLFPRTLVLDLPPAPIQRVQSQALTILAGTITRNATLESLLGKALGPLGTHQLVVAAKPLHDLARLSVGQPFQLTVGPDGVMAAFTYSIDELRTLVVRRNGSSLEAEVHTKSYETRVDTVSGSITSSLFGAVEDAGEEDLLAVDLAAIFEWDVDFNTELQKGDSFRLAVEKQFLEGRFSRYGAILAAELLRGERVLRAVRFDGAKGPEYFTPEGLPLRKTFLRSPLKFTRISSGFSRARLHPILNVVRPHLGVDFAAPKGTAVRAAGGGVVRQAGTSGGYGKVVKLRHPNGYETLYGHLSRIHVKVGQRVEQGDIIGAVGSTGLSTAPHLDYRMVKDGVYVNPLKVVSPRATPVEPEERVA
ncbi:MAG TPA: peptidoglycan DD-metalloendopeptidase family protein, partial [Vicinamibacteria bacterium]|nr:peptidoglycan DD-metalloendopeptidase family protein [Vicinamibacteria bacterium]